MVMIVTQKTVRVLMTGALFTTLISVLGCEYPADLWIVPGSIASRLVFGMAIDRSRDDGLDALDIFVVTKELDGCDKRASYKEETVKWVLVPSEDAVTRPRFKRLRYGQVPLGYVQRHRAEPLTSGCYKAAAMARGRSGSTWFKVALDGSVQELSKDR